MPMNATFTKNNNNASFGFTEVFFIIPSEQQETYAVFQFVNFL